MAAQPQPSAPSQQEKSKKPRFDMSMLNEPASVLSARKWASEAGQRAVVELPLDNVLEDPENPRTRFETETLYQLAASIKTRGVMQPILVREKNDLGHHIIIQGARRYRASRIAGKTAIPAIIIPNSELSIYDDYSQVIENVQRENLDAEDLCAFIVKRLAAGDKKAYIAEKMGIHPQDISSYLVIQDAPDDILMLFRTGKIGGIAPLYDLIRLQKKSPEHAARLIAHAETDLGEITRAMVRQALKETEQPKTNLTNASPPASERTPGSQEGEGLSFPGGASPGGEEEETEQEGLGTAATATSLPTLGSTEDGKNILAQSTKNREGDTDPLGPDSKQVVQLPFHNPSSHKASGGGRIPDPNHIKKPLLLGKIDGQLIKILLTRRPSSPGLVHVSFEDTGIEQEVALDQIALTLLSEMKLQETA